MRAGEILLSVIEYDENHFESMNDLAALEILNCEPEKSLEYIRKIRNIDYSNQTTEENLKYLKRFYGEEKITSSLYLI